MIYVPEDFPSFLPGGTFLAVCDARDVLSPEQWEALAVPERVFECTLEMADLAWEQDILIYPVAHLEVPSGVALLAPLDLVADSPGANAFHTVPLPRDCEVRLTPQGSIEFWAESERWGEVLLAALRWGKRGHPHWPAVAPNACSDTLAQVWLLPADRPCRGPHPGPTDHLCLEIPPDVSRLDQILSICVGMPGRKQAGGRFDGGK